MAAVPEAPSARPKNTRTYGKARADAAVPIEDRLGALDNASLKDLPLRHSPDNITSPPGSPESDTGGFTYGWKARLEAIDAGEEDDNLPSLDHKLQPFPLSSPPFASSTNTPHNKRVQSPSKSASSSPISPSLYPLDASPSFPDLTLSHKRSCDMDAGPVIAALALDTISPSLPDISPSICATSRGMDAPDGPGLDQSDDEAPKKSEKGKKPKKLTKKELIETQKESARLKAAKNVSLRGSSFVPKARPISNLLEILQQSVVPQRTVSSPIDSFSSSQPSNPPSTHLNGSQWLPSSATLVASSNKVPPSPWEPNDDGQAPSSPYEPPPPTFPSHVIPSFLTSSKSYDATTVLRPPTPNEDEDDDEDDDDMLHPDVVVARGIEKSKENAKEKENRARAHVLKLQALKFQAMKHTTAHSAFSGIASEEDDVEIDAARALTTTTNSRATDQKGKGRQLQPFLADTISRVKKSKTHGVTRAAPFGPVVIAKQTQAVRKLKAKDPVEEHRERLLTKAALDATEARKAKEADWVARGGTLLDAQAPKGPMLEEILGTGAERLREIEQRLERDGEDEEDQEDGDYQPHGETHHRQESSSDPLPPLESAGSPAPLSPSSPSESFASGSSPFFQRTMAVDGSPSHTSPPTSTSEGDADHGIDTVLSLPQRRKTKKSLIRRVVSDDEDEEDSENPRPRPPGSGAGSDAENTRPIMDDSDLENIPPLVVQQVSTGLDDDDTANGGRAPLRALSSFSSSLSLSSISRVSGKPMGALTQGEKRHLDSASRSGPLAELRDSTWQADENVGETDFGFGGMSQLFEATQGVQSQNNLLRDGPVRGGEFNLSLSTQASALLPAVKISDSRRRMNDNILIQQEEDMGLAIREQASSPSNDRKRLFLNEDGFLTQTISPSWNQPVFSAREEVSAVKPLPEARSSQNRSKAVASHWNEQVHQLSSVAASPPRRRLLRGRTVLSPSPSRLPSLSPRNNPPSQVITDATVRTSSPTLLPKQPVNAFQLLMNPTRQLNKEASKNSVDRAIIDAFVEREAEESDDETPFDAGFGVLKGKDNEDDGEGPDGGDGHIKDLVDDQEMDEETQAKGLVLEKAHEHAAEDDAKALKIAQDTVEGNFRNGRNKRRRGVDGLDDDSESENDEVRRPKVEKKRRIKDDRLPEMAKNPETLAFFQAYKKGHDDDEEGSITGAAGGNYASDADMGDDDSAEDEAVETITATEIREQVRQAKRKADSSMLEFDPDNIEWIGLDPVPDEDDDLDVEIVQSKPARANRSLNLDVDVEDEWRQRKSSTETSREETNRWEGQPQGSRAASTGTNGRAAVTGYDRRKRLPNAAEGPSRRTNLTKSASVLSSLNTKKVGGFE